MTDAHKLAEGFNRNMTESLANWLESRSKMPTLLLDSELMISYAKWLRARPAAQEGFVLVPREPTSEMIQAMNSKHAGRDGKYFPAFEMMQNIYRAMLAAAPQEPK